MSLEIPLTEEPLPTNAGAGTITAQLQEPKPQQHSHSITLMPLFASDKSGTPVSEPQPSSETALNVNFDTSPQPEVQPDSEPDIEADAQILEALRSSKDRLFVLKLGESMESLIHERHIRNRIELTPASTYHKLLVHRCAAYYKLAPETEAGSKAIALVAMSESRIPPRKLSELVPPDDSPLPAFKIMRRTPQSRTRSKASSQGGSGNDDIAGIGDTSDGDPSEAGSSRSSRKRPLTMSERQAQYEEARSRIFKDLEDKEKAKAQDMSASSSTLSLLSVGSSSGGVGGGGGSSVGESLDETGSIDRDWASTGSVDKQDSGRRTSASGSSRSIRPSAPAFNGHGHSPGVMYPTLYEPAPTPSTSSSSSYDSSPSSGSSSHGSYHPTLYPVYQYGAPAYLAPYPYAYYPYAPPHPPPPPPQLPESAANSTNGSPASSPADAYPPPVTYMNAYVWGGPPPPPPPSSHHQPQHNSQQSHQQPQSPLQDSQQQQQQQQTQQPPPTQAFAHPPYPPFPVHAFPYPPPGHAYLQPLQPPTQQPAQPYPHNAGRPQTIPDGPRPANPALMMNHVNGSNSQPQLYQPAAYDASREMSPASRNGGGPPPKRMPARAGWSYGPGVGGSVMGVSEAMGPRMSMGRRTSGSSSVTSKTPGDETASTTSSSTSSSSSKQTFMSTSSKHPLPARPDWAVGLKPQPTLHHSTSHHSSPRSYHGHLPSQSHSHHHGQPRQSLSMPLQSNDFPPLTMSAPNAEKRPILGGVWAGSSTTRNILGPSLGRLNNAHGVNGNGNGVISSPESTQQNTRLDEPDRVYERPGPKAGGELFNPGLGSVAGGRAGTKSPTNGAVRKDKEKAEREKAIANAILVDRVGALRIGNESNGQGEDQGGGGANGASAEVSTP